MVLMHVAIPKDKEKKSESLLDTTLFWAVYPEAPPFKNPKDDLLKIGISPRPSYIRAGMEVTQH